MNIPILNSIMSYLQGDGSVILPEIELTLFGLGILLIGFSLDEASEEHWFWKLIFKDFYAKAAFAGVLFSTVTVWRLRGAVAAAPDGELLGFQRTVIVDSFFLFFRRPLSGGHRSGHPALGEVLGNRR